MNVSDLKFLTPREKEILKKNKLDTLLDVVYYFPYKYQDAPQEKFIKDIVANEFVTISGELSDIQAKTGFYKGTKYTKAVINDGTETIEVVWWNMPFIAKNFHTGERVTLTGTVSEGKNGLLLNSPKVSRIKEINIETRDSLFQKEPENFQTPVYTPFKNVKNFQIRKIIEKALKSDEFRKIENLIPESVANPLSLGSRQNALVRRHLPQNKTDIQVTGKYFAFEEIFLMQVYRCREKNLRQDAHTYKIVEPNNFRETLNEVLPFKLTNGQNKVLEEIIRDLKSDKPMSRLVEGDVGSGKTALALAAAYLTVLNTNQKKPLQVAYIAPTEILATQHFETFIKLLCNSGLHIALLTRTGAKIWPSKIEPLGYTTAPKSRIKKLLDQGKLNIVIGTHALFNKSILFENLGLVIIDEQHRFGVKQRMNLIEKHKNREVKKAKNDLRDSVEKDIKIYPVPHLLSMSATPIPRTLALTIYGDLDLSVLDELPPGRKRAETKLVRGLERNKVYEEMQKYLKRDKQVYIIAPRIKDEDTESKKTSVEFEAKRIQNEFPLAKIGIMHGKLNKQEKDEIIQDFYKQRTDILVSTTVVEVGVSVPNATFIIIENADTYGLSQLHQLRGRVERSTDDSICYLISESESENSLKRLQSLVKSSNGFELAEVDMLERGPGSLIGRRQSGLSDIGMEAIKNRRLVELAKESAEKILKEDFELKKYKELRTRIEGFEIHEE